MGFIQVIEVTTTKIDQITALVDKWRAETEGVRKARRGTVTQDRDRPNTYLQIVEFDSYDDAMANSALPTTASFAEKLAALCDSPPSFRNLDVLRVEEM
jgi:hypothetical protein